MLNSIGKLFAVVFVAGLLVPLVLSFPKGYPAEAQTVQCTPQIVNVAGELIKRAISGSYGFQVGVSIKGIKVQARVTVNLQVRELILASCRYDPITKTLTLSFSAGIAVSGEASATVLGQTIRVTVRGSSQARVSLTATYVQTRIKICVKDLALSVRITEPDWLAAISETVASILKSIVWPKINLCVTI